MHKKNTEQTFDAIMIGAGIMSATMAFVIKTLQPKWRIAIYERLDQIGAESSDAWNNAGTGHAAYCELNYTTERADGTIDCSKAFKINEQFELSRQFWAYLVEIGVFEKASDFVQQVPHISFVTGLEDVDFLRKRFEALRANHLFGEMEYSSDREELATWMPLVMRGRAQDEPVAATRVMGGTDVNFGALTRGIFQYLETCEGIELYLKHEVEDLKQDTATGHWNLEIENKDDDETFHASAAFVFIGAGGYALDLLNKSEIPQADGFGGFPVSGRWLRCTNPKVIAQHQAKVYGKAKVGSPPMSVPHLDSRFIDGKHELLFGPFAGFSTRFLKRGSLLDLAKSIDSDNLVPMLEAGLDNIPLTRYLIGQIMQSDADRLDALKEYLPEAQKEDWELMIAGQRVQVIRDDEKEGGVLEFGTQMIHALDGSIAALLGASPGASTAVAVVLDILKNCFHKEMTTEAWQKKLEEILPSHHSKLSQDRLLALRVKGRCDRVLYAATPNS
jgi:malate dehydrogenase (quinone)